MILDLKRKLLKCGKLLDMEEYYCLKDVAIFRLMFGPMPNIKEIVRGNLGGIKNKMVGIRCFLSFL